MVGAAIVFLAAAVAAVVACDSDPPAEAPAKKEPVQDAGCPPVTDTVVDGISCTPLDPAPTDLHIAVNEFFHVCAWRTKGPVSCWGRNGSGEVGDPSLAQHTTPFVVPGISDVLQVTVGDWADSGFSCALLADHTVVCWGANDEGQLGDGTMSEHPGAPRSIYPAYYRATPAPVVGLSDVVEIASAVNYSCARLANGEVWCWGMGRDCTLGNGTIGDAPTPVKAIGLSDVTQLALGSTFACALKADGTVYCWGANSGNEVDDSGIAALVPTQVPGIMDVQRIAAIRTNVCAQTKDGRVYCWGGGLLGRCAAASGNFPPGPVHGLPCGALLAPSGDCVVTTDGSTWCWGIEAPTKVPSYRIVPVYDAPIRIPVDAGIAATAGFGAMFLIDRDGRLWSWGRNEYGQLGNGTTTEQRMPALTSAPP